MMLSKKWMAVIGGAVLTGVLATSAAFAGGNETLGKVAGKRSPGVQELMTEIRTLRQTRMEQLKTEVETLIDQAAEEGKITPEEADRLKAHSQRMHKDPKHGPRGEMKGFFKGASEAEVKSRLDEAVKNGRITQEQAEQMLKRWQEWQAKQQPQS